MKTVKLNQMAREREQHHRQEQIPYRVFESGRDGKVLLNCQEGQKYGEWQHIRQRCPICFPFYRQRRSRGIILTNLREQLLYLILLPEVRVVVQSRLELAP